MCLKWEHLMKNHSLFSPYISLSWCGNNFLPFSDNSSRNCYLRWNEASWFLGGQVLYFYWFACSFNEIWQRVRKYIGETKCLPGCCDEIQSWGHHNVLIQNDSWIGTALSEISKADWHWSGKDIVLFLLLCSRWFCCQLACRLTVFWAAMAPPKKLCMT